MSPWRSDQATLEQVCVHEYAHWHVARALGACGFVRIRRIADFAGAPARFAGTFQMHGELDERAWRVVALAGTVAEWMLDAPALTVDVAVARLAAGAAMSSEDARLARGFDREDVERCLALLREHWAALLGEAAERAEDIRRQLHFAPPPALGNCR